MNKSHLISSHLFLSYLLILSYLILSYHIGGKAAEGFWPWNSSVRTAGIPGSILARPGLSAVLCECVRPMSVCVLCKFAALWALVTMGTAPIKVFHSFSLSSNRAEKSRTESLVPRMWTTSMSGSCAFGRARKRPQSSWKSKKSKGSCPGCIGNINRHYPFHHNITLKHRIHWEDWVAQILHCSSCILTQVMRPEFIPMD